MFVFFGDKVSLVVDDFQPTNLPPQASPQPSRGVNVFAYQPTRLFVHAFTLTGTAMETWIFDRSGPYSGATFDIHEEPEKFIRVMCGYLMMSDEELGLDTFTTAKDNKLFVTIPVKTRGQKRKRQLELDPKPIAHQRAIVCRGT